MTMVIGNKLCLMSAEFETNLAMTMRDLREEKDLFDVTLACEDKQIEAHKLVLCASSSLFKELLKRNSHPHPLLYLRGVKYKDIQTLLNFMYDGEVCIGQEDLQDFIDVARDLKLKGLSEEIPVPKLSKQAVQTQKRIKQQGKPPTLTRKRGSFRVHANTKRFQPNKNENKMVSPNLGIHVVDVVVNNEDGFKEPVVYANHNQPLIAADVEDIPEILTQQVEAEQGVETFREPAAIGELDSNKLTES